MPITPSAPSDDPLTPEERELLEKLLREAARNSRIQCSGALAIADSLGISSRQVGRVATQLDIKISGCQLGCF